MMTARTQRTQHLYETTTPNGTVVRVQAIIEGGRIAAIEGGAWDDERDKWVYGAPKTLWAEDREEDIAQENV